MKVIALLGSPRKEGNTDILAGEVLRGAQDAGAEIKKVYLDDLWIRPIGEVGDNSRERVDPRDDDDFPHLLEHFLNSDVVILASPIYWQGASAQMKCFIDRLSSYFKRPPYAEKFHGKKYIVVCTFGREEANYHEWITRPLKLTIELLQGEYFGDICVSVYRKGGVRGMPDVLASAYEIGKAVITKAEKE